MFSFFSSFIVRFGFISLLLSFGFIGCMTRSCRAATMTKHTRFLVAQLLVNMGQGIAALATTRSLVISSHGQSILLSSTHSSWCRQCLTCTWSWHYTNRFDLHHYSKLSHSAQKYRVATESLLSDRHSRCTAATAGRWVWVSGVSGSNFIKLFLTKVDEKERSDQRVWQVKYWLKLTAFRHAKQLIGTCEQWCSKLGRVSCVVCDLNHKNRKSEHKSV